MSVGGRVYKRCGCLNPGTRRRWGIHCPQLTRTGHGSWYVAIELPTGPNGARRRLRRGGYRTRTEAHHALTELRTPHPADPHRALLTTGQWLRHWLATRLRPRPATLRSYSQHIHQHLLPHLGGIVLHELSLDDVQTAFAILARTPTRYGRARAASTLHRIRATLRVALNAAMRRGLIEANPAHYLELPPASRPKAVVWTSVRVAHWRATGERPTVAVWTACQTAQFLHHIRLHRLYPLFRLITLVGLRRGEACALRWCDIDLHHRTLVVCRQLQYHGGELALCETKTAGSVRMIALDQLTVTVLRRHHATTPPPPSRATYPGSSSLTAAATRSNPTGSASCSSAWSGTPTCPRSGCMTCATAPPACRWPPATTSKRCRRCWAIPASCSPPTPTPVCYPTSPTTPLRPPHG